MGSPGLAEALLESSPLGALMVDRDGRVLWANSRVEHMFGYGPGELVGQPVDALLPERLRVTHEKQRAAFLAHPVVRPMGLGLDLSARRKDGTEFPVEVSLSTTQPRPDGPAALAFVTDISRRKGAERRLATAYAITQVLADAPPLETFPGRLLAALGESLGCDAAEWWSVDGDRLEWEAGWSASGVDVPTLKARRQSRGPIGSGPPLRALTEARSVWVADLERDFEARDPLAVSLGFHCACAFPVRSGSRASAAVVLFNRAATAPDGEMLQALTDVGCRIGDHLEHRRIEQELAFQREALHRAEKLAALGRLVAGVAHEMNNPLGIISSRIELMVTEAESEALPAQHLEDLKVVHRNVLRVAEVARALRSFARQSSGERRPINLNDVVEETLLLIGKPRGPEGVRITAVLDPALPLLRGDANAIQQVLLNLLTNAREAVGRQGAIHVQTALDESRPGRIRLTVSDTGPGIPPTDLPRLFEPFFTTKTAGTGLGLAVSYGIVQDHQGTIEARSVPGQGAAFVLSFPSIPAA